MTSTTNEDMDLVQAEIEAFEKTQADVAAQFFNRLQFHNHFGVWDGDDKVVIYSTRGDDFKEAVQSLIEGRGYRYSVGEYDRAWAFVVYNYRRDPTVADACDELLRDAYSKYASSKHDDINRCLDSFLGADRPSI
jgi:hypothetical protein